MPIKCEEYSEICVLTPGGDFAGVEADAARKIIDEQIEKKQIVDAYHLCH